MAGAAAGSEAEALAGAVGPFVRTAPLAAAASVVVAAADAAMARDPLGPARRVAALLATGNRTLRVVAPSRFFGGRIPGRGDDHRWQTISLPQGTGRLDQVHVPAALTGADALIVVNRLPGPSDCGSPVIGVWSRFVGPLLRLGALASGAREGLAAEIALAFRPTLIVLTGEVRGLSIAVATGDQVAGELIARALGALARTDPDPATAIGPWEEALVQRATELNLGVAGPTEIDLRAVWMGADDSLRANFEVAVADVCATLGIPAWGRGGMP